MNKIINKPWGKEEWLELNDRYCYKRIYINAGYKTSYQYHNFKRETNFIISGEAEIWLENDEGVVEKKIMKAGDYFNVTPPKKHRVIALTDIILQEVSTPEVDDVIRIEDDTNRPDGKIDAEHQSPVVLILCAGFGSRLKKLTSNINKTLLPLNNQAILTHIIQKFPPSYEFILALGYKSQLIKDYCSICFPNYKFTFVDVDRFDGIGTGPGYSALKCKEYLQRPFYFTTADSVLDINTKFPQIDGNWLGVYPTSYPEKYSTIQIDDSENITSFINKNENGFDLAFTGVGGIYDYEIFWSELEKNIGNDGELVSAFEQPKNYPKIKVKKLHWLDTGNLDDLEKTKRYYHDLPLSLVKENGEINYHEKGKFIKFIPDTGMVKRKVKRSEKLKELIPTNFGFKENYIYYDWIKGKTLYEVNKIDIFNKFLSYFSGTIKDTIVSNADNIESFYKVKTKERLDRFIEKFGEVYFTNKFTINGELRLDFETIFKNIDFNSLKNNPSYELFHGDLQFDNVIYSDDNEKFYYIDWRDSFGGNTEVGDVYYDLSKLYGGLLIPYNLMKNEDNITYNEGSENINFSFSVSSDIERFRKIYEKWVVDNGYDLKKIKMITGLIFLNMSPLHSVKFGKMLWFKSIEMLSDYDK